MLTLLSQESAWSLDALLGHSAAAASACAAWFALGSAAAWQRQKILTSLILSQVQENSRVIIANTNIL